MLCIAAKHDPIGYVAIARVGLDSNAIARLTGGDLSEVESLIEELARSGVFSRDRHGTIYNRRMVRDDKKRRQAQKNGRLGGNPALKKTEENGGATPSATKTCRSKTRTQKTQNVSKNAASLSDGEDEIISSLDNRTDKACLKPIPIPIPESNPSKPPPDPPGGGGGSEGGTGPPKPSANEIFERLLKAANNHVADTPAGNTITPILWLIENGCDLEKHILPVVARIVPGLKEPLKNWHASFLTKEILDAKQMDAEMLRRPASEPKVDLGGGVVWPESTLRQVLENFDRSGQWPNVLGFPPGHPACTVPKRFLKKAAE
jgi:hypothetical protein